MKVKVKRLLAVLCGVVMLCSSMGPVVYAQEVLQGREVSEYHEPAGENVAHGIYDIPDVSGAKAAMLTNCSIGISVNADGVKGSIKTGSTVQASEIGVENIRLEAYVDGKWTLVGSHPGGSKKSNDAYVMEIYTTTAQKGVQYRISCTHYAILEGVRHAVYNVTDGVYY